MRDQGTASPEFRRLTEELVTLLAYEATRDVRVEQVHITTPVAPTEGVNLSRPRPLVVPILRAGLGMLEGMMRLMPTAEVGFLGMVRNEETLEASTYAERLPADLSGRQCYVLDPMLATGGTLAAAIQFLTDRGADHITCVCLLVAPEGVQNLEDGPRRDRRPGHRGDRRARRATSTRRATSSRASVTRATGSTAWPSRGRVLRWVPWHHPGTRRTRPHLFGVGSHDTSVARSSMAHAADHPLRRGSSSADFMSNAVVSTSTQRGESRLSDPWTLRPLGRGANGRLDSTHRQQSRTCARGWRTWSASGRLVSEERGRPGTSSNDPVVAVPGRSRLRRFQFRNR